MPNFVEIGGPRGLKDDQQKCHTYVIMTQQGQKYPKIGKTLTYGWCVMHNVDRFVLCFRLRVLASPYGCIVVSLPF